MRYEVLPGPDCVDCGQEIAVRDIVWEAYRQGTPLHNGCAIERRARSEAVRGRQIAQRRTWEGEGYWGPER